MTRVRVPAVPAANESDAYADVAAVIGQTGPLATRREIEPETARAIASWWQSPGAVGHVLASFASAMPVDHEELLADIAASRSETYSIADQQAFDCLSTFVIDLARKVEGRR